jgi:hypothetical protein
MENKGPQAAKRAPLVKNEDEKVVEKERKRKKKKRRKMW